MKIIAVGDIHGNWGKLNALINKQKPDIVLQCGDFGWFPHFHGRKDIALVGKEFDQFGIKTQGTVIYWCPGNHENWDSLDAISRYDKDTLIHPIMKDVYFCEFGAVLTLPDERKVLFVGGADSIDKDCRTEHIDWWKQEVVTESDMYKLPEIDSVDIVISHTVPMYFIEAFPVQFGDFKPFGKLKDMSCIALNMVFDRYKPKQWFSGHFHKYMFGHFNGCDWKGLNMPNNHERWWNEV